MPFSLFRKNRTPRKPHLANAGGIAAEIKDLRDDLFSEISGSLWGLQTAWFIDPVNGKDDSLGSTSATAIKTMGELNNRLDNLRLKVAPTITVTGDVLDQPFLFNGVIMAALNGTALTINGTVTTEKSGTITVVSSLGDGGNTYPFQLTTTGITWTSGDIGKRVSLASGHVSWVQEFVDANNVVVGQFVNSSNSTTTPGNVAITVDTLTKICTPGINSLANGFQLSVILNHLDFDQTFSTQFVNQGSNMQLFGCRITKNSSQNINNGPATFRGCGFPGAATHTFRGSAVTTVQSCTFVAGAFSTGPTQMTLTSCSFSNCPITFNSPQFTQITNMRIRNTANPITVQNGGVVTNNTNSKIHGATGNTGVGITVKQGSQFQWVGAAAKPTVTGASDVMLGTTGMNYTTLGTGLIDLNATAPTAVTGSGSALYQV